MSSMFTTLYVRTLRDLVETKTRQLTTLPKLADLAESTTLRQLIQTHRKESKAQVVRLTRIIADFPDGVSDMISVRSAATDISGTFSLRSETETSDFELTLSLRAEKIRELGYYSSAFSLAKMLDRRGDSELLGKSLKEITSIHERLEVLALTLGCPLDKIAEPAIRLLRRGDIRTTCRSFSTQRIALRDGSYLQYTRSR